jgi:outer membrane protein TolC
MIEKNRNYSHQVGHTILLCIALTLALANTGAAETEKLTLADSVKIALDNSPAVQIAKENLRKADAMISAAESGAYPKLNLEGTYEQLDQAPTATFGGETLKLGKDYSRSAALVLKQSIDVFGMIRTGKDAARYGKSSYQYAYDAQVNNTTLDAKTAFFDVLRAQEYLKVNEDTVAQLEGHLKDAESFLKAGTVPKFDVLRAETEVANARQSLIAAQNGVELAKAALNTVLGRPLDAPVDLVKPEMPALITLDPSACTEAALKGRPEVMQAGALIGMNDDMTRIAELGGKPKFDFRWDYNRNFDTSAFSPRKSSWMAFVTASFSIFDGGATKAEIGQAKSDANNSRSVREQVIDGVTLDAKQSYLSLHESRERILAAEKGLEQARESMRVANLRYKGGVSPAVEVLDAQAALTLAETNYVNAVYDYQTALASLERAVGGEANLAKLITGSSADN